MFLENKACKTAAAEFILQEAILNMLSKTLHIPK